MSEFDQLAEQFGLPEIVSERWHRFDQFLLEQNQIHNLVSRNSIEDRLKRHFLDSIQLLPHLPETPASILDLGSGAGFPALVIAGATVERGHHVTMVESIAKKTNFLMAAARLMDINNVTVIRERIEAINSQAKFHVVMARALASLPELIRYARPFLNPAGYCLFMKGERHAEELENARQDWSFEVRSHQSITEEAARILEIHTISHHQKTGIR